MKLIFVILAILSSCSKPDPIAVSGEQRPSMFSVGPAQSELEALAGEPIPSKFRSPLPLRYAMRIEDQIEDDIADLRGASISGDEALETLVNHAVWLLERKGMNDEALNLHYQYQGMYAGMMFRLTTQLGGDIGDFQPLLVWLDGWYQKLEGIFGQRIMRATRLEHLKILNYSIPVVFHPRGYKNEVWDLHSYVKHFAGTRKSYFYPISEYDGFAGVCSYWAVWAACTAYTSGGGSLPFTCSPVADYSAYVIGKWPAPKIGKRIYCKQNACQ